MQNVAFNYFRTTFPLILISKFNLKAFKDQPKIVNLEFSADLNQNKNLPEVLYWVFHSLNFKKSHISFFNKKKHVSGKSLLTKVFLTICKKFGSNKEIILNIVKIYRKMLLLAAEVPVFKSFPQKKPFVKRVLSFSSIVFEEKYNVLVNLSPSFWVDYNFKISITPFFVNGFHFRFLLQNLQLPVF